MLSFKKFLKESFLVESFRDQLAGVIDRVKSLSTPSTKPEEDTVRSIPGFDEKHGPVQVSLRDVEKAHREDARGTYYASKNPKLDLFAKPSEGRPFTLGTHLAGDEETRQEVGTSSAEMDAAHEFAHAWQHAKQLAKGVSNPDDPTQVSVKDSGDFYGTLTDRIRTLKYLKIIHPEKFTDEHAKELSDKEERYDRIRPRDSFDRREYRSYLNATSERNARAIETGFAIYHSYPHIFKVISEQNPGKKSDEIKQLTRSRLLQFAIDAEPTRREHNMSKIAGRYRKAYEDEHTKRMMLAIQHAEEAHLPNLSQKT